MINLLTVNNLTILFDNYTRLSGSGVRLFDGLGIELFILVGLGRSFLALRERLRTHEVFTKDKCFYLNYR